MFFIFINPVHSGLGILLRQKKRLKPKKVD